MELEFFVKGNSFAAPFVSDPVQKYVVAENPLRAIQKFVEDFKHPMGLYYASVYENADAANKKQQPLYNVWAKAAEYNWQNKNVPQDVDPKELVFSAERMPI